MGVYIFFGIAVVLNAIAVAALLKEYLIGRMVRNLIMQIGQGEKHTCAGKRPRRKVRHDH